MGTITIGFSRQCYFTFPPIENRSLKAQLLKINALSIGIWKYGFQFLVNNYPNGPPVYLSGTLIVFYLLYADPLQWNDSLLVIPIQRENK